MYIIVLIIGLLFIVTWNKYYIPRKSNAQETSFSGYIQWLKDKYLNANDGK